MRTVIVVPAYNAARFLPAALDSVLAQTDPDWELVIVDDGSMDSTLAIAESYSRRDPRIRVLMQANGRQAAARNAGYAASSPDAQYVAFLDADDAWEPDALAVLTAALEKSLGCPAAHGLGVSIDSAGRRCVPDKAQEYQERRTIGRISIQHAPADEATTFAMLAFRNVILTPGTVLIRRDAVEQVRRRDGLLFDTEFVPCEDLHLWLRLALTADFAYVDRVLLGYRQHGANQSANQALMTETTTRIREAIRRSKDCTPAQRRLLDQSDRYRDIVAYRNYMAWARGNMRNGRPLDAIKQVRRAAAAYFNIVSGPPSH